MHEPQNQSPRDSHKPQRGSHRLLSAVDLDQGRAKAMTVAACCSNTAVPARGNDDKLSAASFGNVGHRCRLTAGGEAPSPQFFAREDVECAKIVIKCAGNEDEATLGGDRATEGRYAQWEWETQGGSVARGAKRAAPDNLIGGKIDGGKLTPWRGVAGYAERRQKSTSVIGPSRRGSSHHTSTPTSQNAQPSVKLNAAKYTQAPLALLRPTRAPDTIRSSPKVQ
jgi:hypothetical protein